jgi:MFS family permease
MSAGFALGLMLGSRLSATVLSPLLGGWRIVLIVLGVLVFIVGILWFIIHPPMERSNNQRPTIRSVLANLRFVAQFRDLWIYSMATFGVLGLMRGLVGYVPTYLRDIGWAEADADTAITTFFFASLIGVVPLSYLSDRLQNRRIVLIVGTIAMSIGTAMMYFVSDSYWGVVIAMLIAGFFFDAFMSLKNAAITEIKGLEIAMLGSALGFAGMFRNGASTVMPSIGNTLSKFGLNTPFLFWAVSGLLATISLAMIHSQKQKR